MFYSEACALVLNPEATLDELLEAHKIISIEHGYRCCKINYALQDDDCDLRKEFLPLLCRIEFLRIKIKQKCNGE